MKLLSFEPIRDTRTRGCRRAVRPARFEARSGLPTSAVCVVASATRETLSSLLGVTVAMRLSEPAIPGADAWPVIFKDARIYRLHGRVADAAIILRACDAGALAAALFGESRLDCQTRSLSPLECDVLDRLVHAVAANLAAVCGKLEGGCVERVTAISGFATYFELLVEEPFVSRIGIALSRDPAPERGALIETGHLAGVRLRTTASLKLGNAQAATIAGLLIGTTLPITEAAFQRCTLGIGHRQLAEGSCGIANGHLAFCVNTRNHND